MKPIDTLKKAIGGYLIGFNYASDTVANSVKRVIKVIHPLTPLVLAHKAVEALEQTRDFVGQNIHKYAYCTQCRGKGFHVVMSVGGEYVGKEPCPQCHGTGRDFKEMLESSNEKNALPTLSQEEAAIKIFDRMIAKARAEKTIQNVYCTQCKGQRFIHVRTDDGKYLGQKPCSLCEGTGKDYTSMVHELILECLEDHIKKDYSHDEAWDYCIEAYPLKVKTEQQESAPQSFDNDEHELDAQKKQDTDRESSGHKN